MEEFDAAPAQTGFRTVARLLCWGFGGLLAGGTLLYFLTAWATGPSWATTQGSVISASIGTRTAYRQPSGSIRSGGRSGGYRYTLYSPDISYRYQVRGREYVSDGIGDGIDRNYESRGSALEVLGRYTRGPLTVYYDPSNPARSALDTGIVSRFFYIVGGIGLLLIAVGFILRETEAEDESAPSPEIAPAGDDGESGYAPQR